jgi:hypothetical protein
VKLPIKHLEHEKQLTESFEFDQKSEYLGTMTVAWRFESQLRDATEQYSNTEKPVVGQLVLTSMRRLCCRCCFGLFRFLFLLFYVSEFSFGWLA